MVILTNNDLIVLNTSHNLPAWYGSNTVLVATNRIYIEDSLNDENPMCVAAANAAVCKLINNTTGIPIEELAVGHIVGNRFVVEISNTEYYTLFLLTYAGKAS